MSQFDRERRVGAAFVKLAATLVADHDVTDLLEQLVAHCAALLAADAAGPVLADTHGQLRPVAASSEDATTMRLLQLLTEEGPCAEAFRTAAQVRVPDLSAGPMIRLPVSLELCCAGGQVNERLTSRRSAGRALPSTA